MFKTFSINTSSQSEIVDVTDTVLNHVQQSGISDGICVVYMPHTTAALAINENYDPSVKTDFINRKFTKPQNGLLMHEEL